MKHFFKVDITYVPKNAAYKQLQARIDKINKENPRCKNIQIQKHSFDKDSIEYNGVSVIAYLYQVKHDISNVFKTWN